MAPLGLSRERRLPTEGAILGVLAELRYSRGPKRFKRKEGRGPGLKGGLLNEVLRVKTGARGGRGASLEEAILSRGGSCMKNLNIITVRARRQAWLPKHPHP